ncbi:MAG: metallophosphoesterase [Phycisphaerales bacterium]|nr:metallophosphoesterase [Phycisphaerales bacterium]
MRRLAIISDVHFGAECGTVLGALECALAKLKPDVTVFAGDLTLRGRWSEFHEASAYFRRLRKPIVAVPGNHDIPGREPLARFLRPTHRYDQSVGEWSADRYQDAEVAIVGLNSARAWGPHWNWAHGRLSRREVESAAAWLGGRARGALGAVVVHHPPVLFTPRRGFRALAGGAALLGAMQRVGASVVISGHLHTTAWSAVGSVLHLQVGTSASKRLRGQANTFVMLEVREDRLDIIEWGVGEDGHFGGSRRESLARDSLQPISPDGPPD